MSDDKAKNKRMALRWAERIYSETHDVDSGLPLLVALIQEVSAERDAELQLPETVERVARALLFARCKLMPTRRFVNWGELSALMQHEYRELARAAIAALEEK